MEHHTLVELGGGGQVGSVNNSAMSGNSNGGQGGNAIVERRQSNHAILFSGGGAGNKGGVGSEITGSNLKGTSTTTYKGENGTGGLLIIYTKELQNNGKIESNGCNGGHGMEYDHSTSGGSSGGGSINIFYKKCTVKGEIEAIGGEKIQNYTSYDKATTYSGKGGDGSTTIGTIINGTFEKEIYEK